MDFSDITHCLASRWENFHATASKDNSRGTFDIPGGHTLTINKPLMAKATAIYENLITSVNWTGKDLDAIIRPFIARNQKGGQTNFSYRTLYYILFGELSPGLLDMHVDLTELFVYGLRGLITNNACTPVPLKTTAPLKRKAGDTDKCFTTANAWQLALTKRVTSACRDQFGILVDHAVGTGKTLSMWLIVDNFPHDMKKIVIVPRSIIVDFSETGDIAILYPNLAERRKFLKNVEVIPLDVRRVDSELSFIDMLRLENQAAIHSKFDNAIVCVDEVHVLADNFRSEVSGIWDNFVSLREKMSRMVVMTGTPITSHPSDVTIIASMLSLDRTFPLTDAEFIRVYFKQSRADIWKESTHAYATMVQTIGADVIDKLLYVPGLALGGVVFMRYMGMELLTQAGIVLAQTIVTPIMASGGLSPTEIAMSLTGIRNNVNALVYDINEHGMPMTQFKELNKKNLNEYLAQDPSNRAEDYNAPVLAASNINMAKNFIDVAAASTPGQAFIVLGVLTPVILYFYSKFAKRFFENLQNIVAMARYSTIDAVKLKKDISKYVSFFHYNSEIPGKLMPAKFRFPRVSYTEVQVPYTAAQISLVIRTVDRDALFSEVDAKAMGLGLSDDMNTEQTYYDYIPRMGDVAEDSYYYTTKFTESNPSLANGTYSAVKIQTTDKYTSPDNLGHFACPKYLAILSLLLRYATTTRPHLVSESDFIGNLTNMSAMEFKHLQQVDTPQTFKVKVEQVGSGKLQQTLLGGKNGPIPSPAECYVPAVYFAYEKSLKEFSAYLTSLNFQHFVVWNTDSVERRDTLKRLVAMTSYKLGDLKRPICVLLHPAIKLGLSLTYNPCLIMADLVRGAGNEEQIHGRVLRTLNLQQELADYYDSTRDDSGRILKMIYQMRVGYVNNDIATKWAPDDLLTVINASKQKYPSTTIGTYHNERGNASYNRYRKYYADSYVGRLTAFARSTVGSTFDGYRYRNINPTPELFVTQENDQQRMVMTSIVEQLSVHRDDDKQYACGDDRCIICATGQCCQVGPDSCQSHGLKKAKR